jgi:hypothetical protein
MVAQYFNPITLSDGSIVDDTSAYIAGGGLNVNYQILPQGFGSYLQGVLPEDLAIACGAFGYSMQQVRGISRVPVEKFAQAVANLETTKDLLDIGGTNLPVDTNEAQAALDLIALGSGPSGMYTYSDFFGCMSGLPYPWQRLQELITLVQTPTLATIYSNLYTALTGVGNVNVAVQTQIDLANAEISALFNQRQNNPNIQELIDLWEATGTQLGIEQQARVRGLSPLADPRDDTLNIYPITQYAFVDTLPQIAPETQPHMAAQTIENISNINLISGQSMIGVLRETRNEARLGIIGITLDNNISDTLTPTQEKEWIANGTVSVVNADGTVESSAPAYPNTINDSSEPGTFVQPQGAYDAETDSYILNDGTILPDGDAIPGSLAGAEDIIPPELNVAYTSDVLLPATYSAQEAIENVIECNCDCWVQ